MRKAQSAIEYLFMIALALMMVLIAVRLMQKTVKTASENVERANREIIEILRNMTSG